MGEEQEIEEAKSSLLRRSTASRESPRPRPRHALHMGEGPTRSTAEKIRASAMRTARKPSRMSAVTNMKLIPQQDLQLNTSLRVYGLQEAIL